MKYTLIFSIFFAATSAVQIEPKQLNSKADDAFMAKVFEKYSTLGLDSAGEENGKRALLY